MTDIKKIYSNDYLPYGMKQAEYECFCMLESIEEYYRETFCKFGIDTQKKMTILDLNGFPGDSAMVLTRIFAQSQIYVTDKNKVMQEAIENYVYSPNQFFSKNLKIVDRNILTKNKYDVILLQQEQFRSESKEEFEHLILDAICQLNCGGILAVKIRKGFIERRSSYITDVNLAEDFMVRVKTIDAEGDKYIRYLQYISEMEDLPSEFFVGHSVKYSANELEALVGNVCDILEKSTSGFGHTQFYFQKR